MWVIGRVLLLAPFALRRRLRSRGRSLGTALTRMSFLWKLLGVELRADIAHKCAHRGTENARHLLKERECGRRVQTEFGEGMPGCQHEDQLHDNLVVARVQESFEGGIRTLQT